MKLGPVTNLDKRNIATSKNFACNVMLTNCDVIDIFPIYGRFGTMLKPDSGHIALKTYIFSESNLLLTKTENRTKKFLSQLSHYCLE